MEPLDYKFEIEREEFPDKIVIEISWGIFSNDGQELESHSEGAVFPDDEGREEAISIFEDRLALEFLDAYDECVGILL